MQGNVVSLKPQAAEDFPILPTDDVVIIEQLTEETSAGGIVLTGDAKKFPSGRIVAVGPGRTYDVFMDASGQTMAGKQMPMQLKVGDWVIFGKYNSGGEPIEMDGKRYLMCRERDVGGVSRTGEALKVRLSPNPPAA